MKLYFIRHGKASYDAPSDEQRPLLPEGVQQAQDLGKILNEMGVEPHEIFSSPRLRAQETATEIGKILKRKPVIHDACNFDFSYSKALNLAKAYPADAQILFVGHNPSMSEVIGEATGALVDLSTGGAACVVIANAHSNERALLKWLLTAKLSAKIAQNEKN